MTRTSIILIAAALTTAAGPAIADWERIGSLNVAGGKTGQFSMEFFKGNVIGLTARDADIVCNRVTATFDTGDERPIFKGKLPKGLSVRVDLPPGTVKRVNFDCHPALNTPGVIDIAADSGAPSEPRG